MTPEERERLAILCEKRFAGAASDSEMDELTRMLDASPEAHQIYLHSVELHVALGSRTASKEIVSVLPAGAPRRSMTSRLLVGFAIAASILFGIFLALSRAMSPSDDPKESMSRSDPAGTALKGTGAANKSNGDMLPPPRDPVPGYTGPQIDELRRGVYADVSIINMSAILSECMRYRNLTNEWGRLQANMANYDGKVKSSLSELSKAGQKVALEPYLMPGDQILGLAQRDLTTMPAGEAAQVIHAWVNRWRAGPTLEQINVLRGDKKMTLYVEFPEETPELLKLVRLPALAESGVPGDLAVGEIVDIPADLLQKIHSSFESLPKGYRDYLIPADRSRLDRLVQTKKGSATDIDWLKGRLLGEALPGFQREAEMIRTKVGELEPKLKDNIASDVIYRKQGGKVEGQIIQETGEFVKIKSRFGAVSIPREDIEKIEKGKGAAVEFPAKFQDSKGSLDKLVPLLDWCTEKKLKLEGEYTAYTILTLDASNEKARTTVGLVRPSTPK